MDENLVCDHSNESYWAVLPGGVVCLTILQNEIQDFFPQFWTQLKKAYKIKKMEKVNNIAKYEDMNIWLSS